MKARRRRSDAERSSAAILGAAIDVLGGQPTASLEDIAAAAGLSRQTIYAHYPSRDALLAAVVERITAEVTAALDAQDLDSGSAADALCRWVDACWRLMERYPLLLNASIPPAPTPTEDYERHQPILGPLTALVARGQRAGEFDDKLGTSWLVAAIIALGHAAGAEVAGRRMTAAEAGAAFRESVLRLCLSRRAGCGTPTPRAPGWSITI